MDSNISQSVNTELVQYGWQIAAVVLIVVIAIFFARDKIRDAWIFALARRRLSRLGYKQISKLQMADGLGGTFDIDRLVMRRGGISLIMDMRYPGSIFCADNIEEWTQMLNGKSYRFRNPLIDLDYQVKTVSALVPEVHVDGYLFFDHHAKFPKGKPERIISLDDVPYELQREKKADVGAEVRQAWQKLCELQNL